MKITMNYAEYKQLKQEVEELQESSTIRKLSYDAQTKTVDVFVPDFVGIAEKIVPDGYFELSHWANALATYREFEYAVITGTELDEDAPEWGHELYKAIKERKHYFIAE